MSHVDSASDAASSVGGASDAGSEAGRSEAGSQGGDQAGDLLKESKFSLKVSHSPEVMADAVTELFLG